MANNRLLPELVLRLPAALGQRVQPAPLLDPAWGDDEDLSDVAPLLDRLSLAQFRAHTWEE